MNKDRDLYERLGTLYTQTFGSDADRQEILDNAPNAPGDGAVSVSFLSAENISAISDGDSHTSMFSLNERDLEEAKKHDASFMSLKNSGKEKAGGAKARDYDPESSSAPQSNNSTMFNQSQPFNPSQSNQSQSN